MGMNWAGVLAEVGMVVAELADMVLVGEAMGVEARAVVAAALAVVHGRRPRCHNN